MELIVLGAQAWPGPGGASSGYLLEHEGTAVVLDLGNGTLARLQEQVALDDVDAFCISHAHPDHFADLYSVWVASAFGELMPPGIELHAPPGFLDTMGAIMSEDSRGFLTDTFAFVPAHDGDRFEIGSMQIQIFAMNHPNDAVGYRVEADGASFAYTGDTGPSERVADLARGVDVLLCEATYQESAPEAYPFHLTGDQAGRYAAGAGVGRLVLTHQWPSLDSSVTQAQAAEHFSGPIDVADSGLTMEVG